MKRWAAWSGVVLLPVVVLGGLWGARRDLTQPNWFLGTQMTESPAYKTQSANPALPNNTTMQTPVDGTLARGAHRFRFEATDEDRLRAGRELANPFSPSPETLIRGQVIYETFCLVCHGASGRGDGPLIPTFPNPPDYLSEGSRKLTDGEMFHTITLGRNKMGSHASQVSWDDRWQVILYIRSLQEANQ